MEGHNRIILERIARNLPVITLKMGRVETDQGEILIAWGADHVGRHYGVWGADVVVDGKAHAVARDLQFANGTTEAQVKQTLVDDGYALIACFNAFGIFKERQTEPVAYDA